MNFNDLMAKMRELDQPVPETNLEAAPVVADECGDMPPAPMAMAPKEDGPPPSMSINLNAQGLDNIEELMKLIKAVNPGMEKPAMPMGGPEIEIEPMDKPMGLPPLKMLPDMDADNDEKPGGEMDMDDKEEKEGFQDATTEPDPEFKDTDYMVNKLAGGMNKPKQMHKHSYKQGDNPMAMPEGDLRSQIRAELLRRLEEAKGAK